MHKLFLAIIAIVLSSCQGSLFKAIYNLGMQKTPPPIEKKIEVALVLGGGGARAIAHLGVIEVLQENNIPIDLIVGTSAGSIIGAIYADNPNILEVKTIGLNFKRDNVIKLSLRAAIEGTTSLRGGFDGIKGEKFINQTLKAKDFKELKIPFIAVATDVISGTTVGLRSGKIAPAIRASCAIPGLFSPVEMYGMILVDGGVTAPLAVDIAKEYHPKLIIAVDVSLPIRKERVKNMFELVHRSAHLTYNALNELDGKKADILIKPRIDDIRIFDDHKNEEIFNVGKAAALEMLHDIQEKLK